ncbi:MAG: nucleotidyltransferase [Candidatus Bathyarchaeia archaeon]
MSLIAYTVRVAGIFNRLDLKYALVGGLVCILMGIRRITEDADFIVEVKSFSDLEKLFSGLKEEGFDVSLEEVKDAYANKSHFTILVDGFRLDFKFASSTLDFETLKRAVEVEIEGEKVKIARLEENIAAKILVLSSLKDVEDALWLMINHHDKIDWSRLQLLLNGDPKKMIENILLEIEREFQGDVVVLKKLYELKSLLKPLP